MSVITLHFKKAVYVQINGTKYEGADIEMKDIKTASEVVRLAKQAYGWDILK